jgi:hypothetical protein
MAVELLPDAVLASLARQLNLQGLQDKSSASASGSVHVLRAAAGRAAGLLLLSEVLAAEAEGLPLPEDLPQLFIDAVAHTALPAATSCTSADSSSSSRSTASCLSMWQHAAVLACSCSRVMRELQMSSSLAQAFNVAARQVTSNGHGCTVLIAEPDHAGCSLLHPVVDAGIALLRQSSPAAYCTHRLAAQVTG